MFPTRLEGCTQDSIQHLGRLTQLTCLELLSLPPVSRVSSLLALSTLRNLADFTLQCHGEADQMFQAIGCMTALTNLQLYACDSPLGGARSLVYGRPYIGKLGLLNNLELTRFNLTDLDMEALSGCRQLETLVARRILVSSACKAVLASLKALRAWCVSLQASSTSMFPNLVSLWQLPRDDWDDTGSSSTPAEPTLGYMHAKGLAHHSKLEVLRLSAQMKLPSSDVASAMGGAGGDSTVHGQVDDTLAASTDSNSQDDMLLTAAIATLPALTTLVLDQCQHLGLDDCRQLAKAHKLHSLTLYGFNCLTDAGMKLIAAHLKQLRTLWLNGCDQLTDWGLFELVEMPKLTGVTLMKCGRISPAGVSTLACNPTVTSIVVSQCSNCRGSPSKEKTMDKIKLDHSKRGLVLIRD